MKTRLLSATVAALVALAPATSAKKVHTIGDSTMANYDESATATRGWCQYLQQFLEGITVNNRGKGGASSKSFYKEAAYWTSVKQQMQEGDYVLIQFAHNDEKNGGADGDSLAAYYKGIGQSDKANATDYRGTTPHGTYRMYLKRYIDETRAAGCTPVLVAPVCRMYFSGSDIRRNGRHDLGDSFTLLTPDGPTTGNKVAADNHSMDYAWQMKAVAEETGVPFIDLTEATRKLFAGYGDTKCHELLSDGDGSTHLSAMGATLIARLCAQLMEEQGVLAGHIRLTSHEGTATWPFDKGSGNETSAELADNGKVSATSFELGSNLTLTEPAGAGTETLSKLQPVVKVGNTKDNNTFVRFTVVPKKGVTIKPKSLSFKAAKFGTSGGTLDVTVKMGGSETVLAENFNPYRTNDKNDETPEFSAETYPIAIGEGQDAVEICFYVYNLAANKQLGLGDVTLSAELNGEPVAVPVYTMAVKGDSRAGTVTCNPAGDKFDEGTKITVTATENYGYHFEAWTNDDGTVASAENPYVFNIAANTSLTAKYNKRNVYALNMTISGGANANLVKMEPEGHIVNGIRHYEEGTEVKITAVNNRILTFTNWEDYSTETVRTVVMDTDKDITANFSACDYIVGWDFYNDQPAQERAADYKADSENAGLLSLRNADGATTSWLTMGAGKGAQNGKYGARVWKYLSEKWYFQLSFSSVGYRNLTLAAAVGDDYNTYSIINAEYSTDGTTFKPFGTFCPPARGWDSKELALPDDAAGKENVYVRFMPDYSSPLVGVTSDYDGTSVAEIFMLADKDAADDDKAPVLLASIPANGAKGASASGSIVLTFNEKVVAADIPATMGGETLKPTVSGKNVVYSYSALDYSTEYTFILPDGAITDRNGNAFGGTAITFTTMDRKQPEPKMFDAVVAADGTGDYTTLQDAINAAPANCVKPWLVFVKNGEYKEHIDIPENKPCMHIVGQDRDKTIITDDKLCGGENALHVSEGATVVVRADNCYFGNITLENSYGHDKQTGPQALALNTMGDRTVFNNVAMLSYQDTWITPSASNYRAYVKNSLIEGAVDFIYNSGNIFIDNSTLLINRKSGGYIVAPSHTADVEWGYVFLNCTITAPGIPKETDVWLGRPWHNSPKTVFINTRAEVTIPAAGWYETMGGLPVLWADYNTVDADGNPVDLSHRRDTYYRIDDKGTADKADDEKVYGKAKNFLTPEEAAQYTVKNVLTGSDAWQPALVTEAVETPRPVMSPSGQGVIITWQPVPYAICYIITRNGEVCAFTTSTYYSVEGGGNTAANEYTVQAVGEYGALSEPATPAVADAIGNTEAGTARTAGTATWTVGGLRTDSQRAGGVSIVRQADGKVRKVVR